MDDKDKSILMGFLDSAVFDNGSAYRGGCLVTDEETYPIEFRITSSIQPTSLQEILYGKAIIPYIYSELIAYPLTNKLTSEIRFIVVEKEEFLEARPKIDQPLFYINKEINKLIAHNKFPNEQKLAQKVQDRYSLEKLSEPFNRIKSALAEAHQRKIGDE
jgi:hypothetical protein